MFCAFYWLVIGVVLMVLETSFIQRRGLLFAGLAAITVFLLLELKVIAPLIATNIIYFFVLTIVSGVVLWWPLKLLNRIAEANKKKL